MTHLSVSEFFHTGAVLEHAWQQLSCAPGTFKDPFAIPADAWQPSRGTTVCGHLRQSAELHRAPDPGVDGQDHFYRVHLPAPVKPADSTRYLLVCDGLATLASVWFNGTHLGDTENMYRRYAFDVTQLLAQDNELVLRFRALTAALKAKKGPRRWPTRLVNERNLRFVRTTLLGRMPGWTPPWPVVGPFRAVRLVPVTHTLLEHVRCVPNVDSNGAYVDVEARFAASGEIHEVVFELGARRVPLHLEQRGDSWFAAARVQVPDAERWWPHTHGAQPLYPARLRVATASGSESFELGKLGFRALQLREPERFGFRVNGVDVFCRGACWAPLDVVTLASTPNALREALEQVKAAGMNMLRISGTLSYETPLFHELCDEFGILVWQDFMFANMDYPRDDAAFNAEVSAEANQVLERLGPRCSTALYCGGSETEQQAAMMGLPETEWEHPLWRRLLPELVKASGSSVPYFYSTPGGRGMPFWPHDGCTHYYGVGAYLRPLPDARAAGVKFASECLAFASPPASTDGLPALRDRVPQDNGASWDFADVTRHYVREFFGADAAALDGADPPGYAPLAARAVAYAMHQTQTHFRDPATPCAGSLVWMLRDLEPGWGWGLVDSAGTPKSGYRALQSIWAPRAVWFVDEGLSGLAVVVANDPGSPLDAELTVSLLHENGALIESATRSVRVPAHGAERHRVEELLGRFIDTSDAYRFGPPAFDSIQAQLRVEGRLLSEERRVVRRSTKLDAARPAQTSEGG